MTKNNYIIVLHYSVCFLFTNKRYALGICAVIRKLTFENLTQTKY